MIIELIIGIGFATDFLKTTEYSIVHETHTIREVNKHKPLHPIVKKKERISLYKKKSLKKLPLKVSFTNTKEKLTTGKIKKSINIYFDFDSSVVKNKEKNKLIHIKEVKAIKGMASPEGSEKYNFNLSKRRAEAVKKELLEKGIKVNNIKALGEKPCKEPPENYPKCRKVEVIQK